MLRLCVLFEVLFVKHENGTNDSRVVLKADLGNKIGNDVQKAVGINDCKGGCSCCGIGNILINPFSEVLYYVRQKFKLIDKVRELRGMDLGELRL